MQKEINDSQKQVSDQKREQPSLPTLKSVYQFLGSVKEEFRKIQWTDGEEVRVYAKIVVLATFVLGMVIYFADVVIHKGLFILSALFKWLFG